VLAEFVNLQLPGEVIPWHQLLNQINNPPPNGVQIEEEIWHLHQLIEHRSSVMAEAMAQRNGILGYFRGLVSFTAFSHPNTYYLGAVALRIAQFLSMHYKAVFKRPRPSRLSPGLLPPVDPPGHAAYPSGHATEAHLLALCLEQVMPREILTGYNPPAAPARPPWGAENAAVPAQRIAPVRPMRQLADRIARNREVMGLHYRSDSDAGRLLAEKAFGLLLRCPSLGLQANAADQLSQGADGDLNDVNGVSQHRWLLDNALQEGLIADARREWRNPA
jgi:hypothetical protein